MRTQEDELSMEEADLVKCILTLYIDRHEVSQAGVTVFMCTLEKSVSHDLLEFFISMNTLVLQPITQRMSIDLPLV